MGIGVNIITIDESVEQMGAALKGRCDAMEQNVNDYITMLEKMCSTGFVSGATSDAIRAFAGVASHLKTLFETVGMSIDTTLKNYNRQIDEADEYLY